MQAGLRELAAAYEALGRARNWQGDESVVPMALFDHAVSAERSGAPLQQLVPLYERGAEAGHVAAMLRLGDLAYQYKQIDAAINWWTDAARAGNTDAMYMLGQRRMDGPH